ncbi:hypothetical protein chiPu_0010094 [Chiloscyllium punctatum]|uniref:Uncharacterized protein n=1 Tax=Chiloscyllium punctatum TaxID=137246 RepID=A0A401SMJ5_CHIPU|nr:hypothetical protein [Chiloscyllium punctatum]
MLSPAGELTSRRSLLSRCTFQQAKADEIRIKLKPSTDRETSLAASIRLSLTEKVMLVTAIPTTRDTSPKGKMQRYQERSVPPVVTASRSNTDTDSIVFSPEFWCWRHAIGFDLQPITRWLIHIEKNEGTIDSKASTASI